ncbi:MAG: outer membrane protein TolC [Gammaproteobacteria bacterium]|jgi:outer membrane protein TolC|nr:outer membrane protein TolC [Gammaproteobacteria bacterium]
MRAAIMAVLVSALTGCAFYHAMPLNDAARDKALAPVPIDRVKVAAANLEHPLVKPLVIDGNGGFSPDEIAVMAVIVSPALRALRDQRGVARAQVIQAGILPNPQLSESIDIPHGNADPSYVSAHTLGLSWDVSALLARHDEMEAARASAEAVDLQVAWEEWQVAQDSRLRAFRLLAMRAQLPLARAIEGGLEANIIALRQGLAGGHKTMVDLTGATDLLTQARKNRLTLEQSITADRLALDIALAQPVDYDIQIKPGTTFPVLPDDSRATDELLAGIENRRFDLVALALGYRSQEATLRAAVKSQFPKIGLSFSRASDTSDVKTLGGGVSIELPLFDRRQGVIAGAKATRQQLFDEYYARLAEARAQVQQILEDLTATRAQLEEATRSLPDLEQLAAAYDKAFQSHNADVLAYRDAQAALATRRMEESKLRQDVLELSVALEIATGRPLLDRTPPS